MGYREGRHVHHGNGEPYCRGGEPPMPSYSGGSSCICCNSRWFNADNCRYDIFSHLPRTPRRRVSQCCPLSVELAPVSSNRAHPAACLVEVGALGLPPARRQRHLRALTGRPPDHHPPPATANHTNCASFNETDSPRPSHPIWRRRGQRPSMRQLGRDETSAGSGVADVTHQVTDQLGAALVI